MRVLDRTCGQLVLSIGVVCLIAAPALAHVGSGLAVDRNGQVYFLDTGSGLWRIDVQGKLAKIDGNRFHWLALDESNALANTRLPSGPSGDFVKVGANPTVILASDWPIAIDQNGNLHYQSGAPGSLRLKRTTPLGELSVVATLPESATGAPLRHLNGIADGPDGAIYYTEDHAIRRITQGLISTAATIPALVGGPSIPGIGAASRPLLRALYVDTH